MDTLSDLLRVVRLDDAFFYAVEAGEPWSVEAVAAKELTPRIMPAAERLISYHILTAGRCYGGLVGEEQVELAPGDVIVFPHGDAHVMSSGRGLRVNSDIASAARPYGGRAATGWPAEPIVVGPGGCGERAIAERVDTLITTRRTLDLRFPFPPAAVTELFATSYGPTVTTLRAADPDGASRLRGELTRLFNDYNIADDGTTTVTGEYLEVQARLA